MVAPTEPNVEADPFAPTEPNVKAQVLFTTADIVASSEPNAAADVMVTTADTAPTEANISEVGSVAWPSAQRHVRLGPPSPRRVEGPKRGSLAAAAIAPTEANFEAQVSSVQAVVFAPTEPNTPEACPVEPTELDAEAPVEKGRAGRQAPMSRGCADGELLPKSPKNERAQFRHLERNGRARFSHHPHVVAASAPDVRAVLGQLRVDAKTNEHKAALELLRALSVKGKVVSGDAMFTHRAAATRHDVCHPEKSLEILSTPN